MAFLTYFDLVKRGFDVDFNVGEIFYSVSSEDPDNSSIVYLGNELKQGVEFKSIDELLNHEIDGKKLKDVIQELPEEEFFA